MRKWLLLFFIVCFNAEASVFNQAVRAGDWQKVERLLDKGANIEETEADGRTSLMICARLSIERPAFFEMTNKSSQTRAKRWIRANSRSQKRKMIEPEYSHLKTLKLLLDRKANIEAKDQHGWTALIYAASGGQVDKVKLLLDYGANIEAKAIGGWTPFIAAAYSGEIETAQELLKRGADFLVITKYNSTALSWAAYNGYIDMMELIRQWSIKKSRPLYGRDVELLEKFGLGTIDGYDRRLNVNKPKPKNSWCCQTRKSG